MIPCYDSLKRSPFDCLKDLSNHNGSYNPNPSSSSDTEVTGPSEDEENKNAGGASGRAKKKGSVGAHAKPEDLVLLFDLLDRLDPKGVSYLKGYHLTV